MMLTWIKFSKPLAFKAGGFSFLLTQFYCLIIIYKVKEMLSLCQKNKFCVCFDCANVEI